MPPEPEPVPSAEDLDRVIDELASIPESDDNALESPGAEEPEQAFPDFQDVKALDEAKQHELHPTVVLYPNVEEPAPSSRSSSSSSSSSSSDVKSKKPVRKSKPKQPSHRQSAPPAVSSLPEPDMGEAKGEPTAPASVLMNELDEMLEFAENLENAGEEAPVQRRSPRKVRKTARKPLGWHAELGEEDLWISEDDD